MVIVEQSSTKEGALPTPAYMVNSSICMAAAAVHTGKQLHQEAQSYTHKQTQASTQTDRVGRCRGTPLLLRCSVLRCRLQANAACTRVGGKQHTCVTSCCCLAEDDDHRYNKNK